MAQEQEKVLPGQQEKVDAAEHKVLKGQAEQMFGKTESHAPATPVRADFVGNAPPVGAPPAQGPNVSKEQAEFAANAAVNKNAETVPEELIPAPTQASSEPLVEAGKATKEKK